LSYRSKIVAQPSGCYFCWAELEPRCVGFVNIKFSTEKNVFLFFSQSPDDFNKNKKTYCQK